MLPTSTDASNLVQGVDVAIYNPEKNQEIGIKLV